MLNIKNIFNCITETDNVKISDTSIKRIDNMIADQYHVFLNGIGDIDKNLNIPIYFETLGISHVIKFGDYLKIMNNNFKTKISYNVYTLFGIKMYKINCIEV